MGGQNHQPTNTGITPASAWLSQKVGDGFAFVLEANGHLENAIMIGMNKLHIHDLIPDLDGTPSEHVHKAIECLKLSQERLSEIQIGFNRLIEIAKVVGYKGNPLASKVKSFGLKEQFEGLLIRPVINTMIWEDLEMRIQDLNILKTLEWEAEQFLSLEEPTSRLIEVLQQCLELSEKQSGRDMADAIENNELPLRQFYAQVFSTWNSLHAMFLYSSLIMTELFYKINAYPSLVEFDPDQGGVNAA